MKSLVVKRSIVIAGHRTSISLDDAFWQGLNEIAIGRDITLSTLVTAIDMPHAERAGLMHLRPKRPGCCFVRSA